MLKQLLRRPGMQAFLARLLGLYLAFALRTTRWTLHGEAYMAPHVDGTPCVVAFWHERLPMMPMLWTLARGCGARMRAHVLVSRHRDGRFIGEVVRRFHLDMIYGSSSKGGASGMRRMIELLAAGDHVAITPDGPRGPCRLAAPGVAQLAAASGAPVLPTAAQTTRHRLLPTWDRMVLPLPFGRGVVICGPAISVPTDGWREMLPAIAAALDAAAAEADRLCAG